MIVFDDNQFFKEMNNIVDYSIGFLEGVEESKKQFMHNIAINAIETLKQFVDSNARQNPQILHHIYEWYQVGNSEARLFDFDYSISDMGIKISSSFSQSKSIQSGSKEPFYNKAEIMEKGMSVVIKPKKSSALAFTIDGTEIFSKSPIVVNNPGGSNAKGGFEQTVKMFFERYFKQSFLTTSGIKKYLENPEQFNKNLNAGKKSGKLVGKQTGSQWMSNAGRIV